MVNHFQPLCAATQQGHKRPVSRTQLPWLLAKVNGALFAKLLFDWLGWTLDPDQKQWFALDGIELRGSIEPGQKRGEACVSALVHDSEEIVGQVYYSGIEESECFAVRQLLDERGLYDQKITLDALHLKPLTVNAVHGAGGTCLIGVKANQAYLYRDCICRSLVQSVLFSRSDSPHRGQGRLEQRNYTSFPIPTTAPAVG